MWGPKWIFAKFNSTQVRRKKKNNRWAVTNLHPCKPVPTLKGSRKVCFITLGSQRLAEQSTYLGCFLCGEPQMCLTTMKVTRVLNKVQGRSIFLLVSTSWVLEIQTCSTMSDLSNAGERTQAFAHVRDTFHPLSHIRPSIFIFAPQGRELVWSSTSIFPMLLAHSRPTVNAAQWTVYLYLCVWHSVLQESLERRPLF